MVLKKHNDVFRERFLALLKLCDYKDKLINTHTFSLPTLLVFVASKFCHVLNLDSYFQNSEEKSYFYPK